VTTIRIDDDWGAPPPPAYRWRVKIDDPSDGEECWLCLDAEAEDGWCRVDDLNDAAMFIDKQAMMEWHGEVEAHGRRSGKNWKITIVGVP